MTKKDKPAACFIIGIWYGRIGFVPVKGIFSGVEENMEIYVIDHEQQHRFSVSEGETLLQALRRNGLIITAPCGGRGTCRKCMVTLEGIGPVLSCHTVLGATLWQKAGQSISQPLVVHMPQRITPQVSTKGMLPDLIFSPLVAIEQVSLSLPSITDQRPDDRRLAEEQGRSVPYRLLAQLAKQLRQTSFKPTYFYRLDRRELLRFVRPDSPGPLGMAFDIGTTTLAAYLCDLKSGKLLASDAMLNPQRAFGADVISRIEAAAAGHQDELQKRLAESIGQLTDRLLAVSGRANAREYRREDIAHVVIAGNTVMLHLLGDLPADAIARTPFIPVSVAARTLSAADLKLPFASDTICQLLPSIAGYVGADITAGILATGIRQIGLHLQKKSLLLDIGTNGEIVLALDGQLIACSTAAGPAFEAANISCGLGGIHGAIDRVWLEHDDLRISVISQPQNGLDPGASPGEKASAGSADPEPLAAGICGSGLVAAIAAFLKAGLIDETGRITDQPEKLPPGLALRIVDQDGKSSIKLAGAAQSTTGMPIYLTQKDIRELQNAKAAIAAGIQLLLEKAGLQASTIDDVYIAGGFGNYLSVDDALAIGLLPAEFKGKTRSAGNTAGMGALACLLEQELFQTAGDMAGQVVYFELSAEKRFSDLYIDAMMFPDQVV
jgi:uncharacterized 2Fe-2S/4Fe-4S cluster protein (DUF4445 family)